jgi:hypothetical protein
MGLLAFGMDAYRLQGLVLWDGDETDGMLFRFIKHYEHEGGGHGYEPRIKWRSTRHTADDLTPVFAELRRKLGDSEEEEIVIDHEQTFEGEHLSRCCPPPVACEIMSPAVMQSTEFPEIQGLVLHPESVRR